MRPPQAVAHELLPATEYQFRVRAKSKQGWGRWSLPSEVYRTSNCEPFKAEAPPRITKVGQRNICLSWDKPRENGLPIDMYELQHAAIGDSWESLGSWKVVIRLHEAHFDVRNLMPATNHSFRILSHNDIGWSEPGPASEWEKTLSTVPANVGKPVLAGWDGVMMTLSWKHTGTSIDNGPSNGSPILCYEVERMEEGQKQWFSVATVPPGEHFHEYKEPYPLLQFRKYRVRALNGHGYSPWAESDEIVLRRLTEAEKNALRKKEKSGKAKLKSALRLGKLTLSPPSKK